MNSHSIRALIFLALFAVFASRVIRAEEAKDVDDCKTLDHANIVKCYSNDISVPDSPGLMIVGLGTDNVLRPTTPQQFGAALSKGLDDKGKPASGFALDFAPYKIFRESTTRQEYVNSRWLVRPLWNTQISAGVGKSDDSDDKTLKVGYGLSTVLWRLKESDPIVSDSLNDCLTKAFATPVAADREVPTVSPPPIEAEVGSAEGVAASPAAAAPAEHQETAEERAERIRRIREGFGSRAVSVAALKPCYKDFDEKFRNATALTVGYATSEVSEDGEWGHRRKGASGVWATLSYAPVKYPGSLMKFKPEFLLQWRDLDHQRVEDPANAGTFVDQSSTLYGVVARLHGDRMNFVAEKNWLRKKLPGVASDRSNKFGVGIEYEVMEGTWLVVSFGGEDALAGNGDETHFRTGIKFGKSEKSLFSAN